MAIINSGTFRSDAIHPPGQLTMKVGGGGCLLLLGITQLQPRQVTQSADGRCATVSSPTVAQRLQSGSIACHCLTPEVGTGRHFTYGMMTMPVPDHRGLPSRAQPADTHC